MLYISGRRGLPTCAQVGTLYAFRGPVMPGLHRPAGRFERGDGVSTISMGTVRRGRALEGAFSVNLLVRIRVQRT